VGGSRAETGGLALKENQILAISGVGGIVRARMKRANDIADRQEAERAYDDWVTRGQPIAK
jgi:hypothetical protein